MKINEEKREKFIECAGKRVNNVLHDMQILEPMARSSVYDFTKEDIEEMFFAMQETLENVKAEFYKKFEEKAKSEKKVFSFGNKAVSANVETVSEMPAETIVNTTATALEVMEAKTEIIPETEAGIASAAEDLATATSTNDSLYFNWPLRMDFRIRRRYVLRQRAENVIERKVV